MTDDELMEVIFNSPEAAELVKQGAGGRVRFRTYRRIIIGRAVTVAQDCAAPARGSWRPSSLAVRCGVAGPLASRQRKGPAAPGGRARITRAATW
jgi:hypothetical protein